jgi:hypothetical protein
MFHDGNLDNKEQLLFWNQVQNRNRIGIKNSGSRTVFELELNLLGIQTYLEKSDKFPKIHICLPFPKYVFRLT